MRVIAGKARSLQLKTVPGMEVRPTTDKIKETLFNMLAPRIPDACFLDMFAGSGAIGIEALSRGAKKAVFIEQSKTAVRCIRENLAHVKMSDEAEVIQQDAVTSIRYLAQKGYCFDLIFMDPPYEKGLEQEVLFALEHSGILAEDGMVIVEASKSTGFEYIGDTSFIIRKTKVYKTNQHVFLVNGD